MLRTARGLLTEAAEPTRTGDPALAAHLMLDAVPAAWYLGKGRDRGHRGPAGRPAVAADDPLTTWPAC
ncbi:hypothetical protein GCM10023238_06390 [Streptomyces heliomycini]